MLTEEEIPKKITTLIIEMHEKLTKVLLDNQIIQENVRDQSWKDAIEKILRHVLIIQRTFLQQESSNRAAISDIMQSMQNEISESLGQQMT